MQKFGALKRKNQLERAIARGQDVLNYVYEADDGERPSPSFRLTEAAKLCQRSTTAITNAEKAGIIQFEKSPSGRRLGLDIQQLNVLRQHFGTERPLKQMLKDPETKLPVVGCANYKGGVGKTTLAVHFATWCWRQGLKVLFIDTDQQGSATCMFGIDPTSLSGKDATLEAFWSESKDFKDVIYNTHLDGLDIVPANVELAHVEITIVMEMMNRESREERMAMFDKLSNGIDTVKDKYDIVILDCPPSLGLLTNIVMLNMTHCFLPVRPSFLDFASTMDYLIKLGELTEKLAPNFEYESIKLVASDYNATSKEHQGMFEMMTESFENLIYPTPILRSDSITKASSELKSVYEYEDSVKATQKRSLDNLDILFEAMLSDIEKSYSKEPLL